MPQIDVLIFWSGIYLLSGLFLYFSLSPISFFFLTSTDGRVEGFFNTKFFLKLFSDFKKPSIPFSFYSLFNWILFSVIDTGLSTPAFGFRVPASKQMAAIICTHNDVYYILVITLVLVSWLLIASLYKFTKFVSPFSDISSEIWYKNPKTVSQIFDSCTSLEVLWTVIPTIILLFIGYPNISLLYGLDQSPTAFWNIKIIGHQWYWTYEYPDIPDYNEWVNEPVKPNHIGSGNLDYVKSWLKYDSNYVDNYHESLIQQLKLHNFSPYWDEYYNKNLPLLEKLHEVEPEFDLKYIMVDNPLIIPTDLYIRALITSSDVIHSWAVPELGVKMDACPGRLNKVVFKADIDSRSYQIRYRSLVLSTLAKLRYPFFIGYWGQCSELCGIGHGFMPIVVHAVPYTDISYMFNFIFGPSNRLLLNQTKLQVDVNYLKILYQAYRKGISRIMAGKGGNIAWAKGLSKSDKSRLHLSIGGSWQRIGIIYKNLRSNIHYKNLPILLEMRHKYTLNRMRQIWLFKYVDEMFRSPIARSRSWYPVSASVNLPVLHIWEQQWIKYVDQHTAVSLKNDYVKIRKSLFKNLGLGFIRGHFYQNKDHLFWIGAETSRPPGDNKLGFKFVRWSGDDPVLNVIKNKAIMRKWTENGFKYVSRVDKRLDQALLYKHNYKGNKRAS